MKKSTSSLFQVERKLITNFFFFYKLFHWIFFPRFFSSSLFSSFFLSFLPQLFPLPLLFTTFPFSERERERELLMSLMREWSHLSLSTHFPGVIFHFFLSLFFLFSLYLKVSPFSLSFFWAQKSSLKLNLISLSTSSSPSPFLMSSFSLTRKTPTSFSSSSPLSHFLSPSRWFFTRFFSQEICRDGKKNDGFLSLTLLHKKMKKKRKRRRENFRLVVRKSYLWS